MIQGFFACWGEELILYHVTLFNMPTQEMLIPRIPGDTYI